MVDKIDQDIKIFQAVVKEIVAHQNFEGGINLVNIGQIRIGTHEEDAPSIPVPGSPPYKQLAGQERALQLPDISGRPPSVPTEVYEDLKILIDKLPRPRFQSLVKLVFAVSYKYCASVQETTDWLGVKAGYVYHWYKKLNLSLKSKRG